MSNDLHQIKGQFFKMMLSARMTRYFSRKNAEIFLFLVVGILTAGIYFALFTIFWKFLFIDYRISVSIAYIASVIFQFHMNRNVTFKSLDNKITNQIIKFIILLLINYVLTLMIVTTLVNKLLLSPYLAIICSLSVTTIIGFMLSRLWVFKISH